MKNNKEKLYKSCLSTNNFYQASPSLFCTQCLQYLFNPTVKMLQNPAGNNNINNIYILWLVFNVTHVNTILSEPYCMYANPAANNNQKLLLLIMQVR